MANMKYDQEWRKDEIENWKKIFIGSESSTCVLMAFSDPFIWISNVIFRIFISTWRTYINMAKSVYFLPISHGFLYKATGGIFNFDIKY